MTDEDKARAAIAAAEGGRTVPDKRNQAERLLNAAMDHIAATLEQPTDIRAWEHLLIYCPREALEQRMAMIAALRGDDR